MKRLLLLLIFPLPFYSHSQKWAKNFDFVDQCICGLSKVGKDHKIGYADADGKVLIPVMYDEGLTFSEGYTAVQIEGKWIFFDSTGKQLSDVRYEDAQNFHNGYAAVMKNGHYGYIDASGKVVIDFQFNNARDFSEGLAPIANARNQWGYIDNKGQTIISPQYDFADSFNKGEAYVMKDSKTFYIDRQNKILHQ
jgi:hypothetical protein